jgi:hypothetical protein
VINNPPSGSHVIPHGSLRDARCSIFILPVFVFTTMGGPVAVSCEKIFMVIRRQTTKNGDIISEPALFIAFHFNKLQQSLCHGTKSSTFENFTNK